MQAKESYFNGKGYGYQVKDCGDHLLYSFDGDFEEVKVRQVSLEDLGLKRVSGGRVVRK